MLKRLLLLLTIFLPGQLWAQHPVFFNRTADNTIRAQMKADYEADTDCTTTATVIPSAACQPATHGGQLYKFLHAQGASDGVTVPLPYFDYAGEFSAVMYRATGNAYYATRAYNALSNDGFLTKTEIRGQMCGNWSREMMIGVVITLDQVWNGLSGAQQTTVLNKLKVMANLCLDSQWYPEDGDQPISDYFGIATLKTAFPADSTIDQYWTAENATRQIGFFTSTGSDKTTRRNALRAVLETTAVGGLWPESQEYNQGTVHYMLMGAEAVRSARGGDDYPEITAWINSACETYLHEFSPGISPASQIHTWSDTEKPRLLETHYTWRLAAMLAGACQGMAAGPRIQDFTMDWMDAGALNPPSVAHRWWYLFNPYATRGDHTTTTKANFTIGSGHLTARTGWTANDHVLWAHFATWPNATPAPAVTKMDHAPAAWGQFEIWGEGEFKLTHPQGYGIPSMDCRGSNTVCLAGHPAASLFGPREYRGTPVWENNETEGYTYFAATMGGQLYKTAQYLMPPTFLMEDTRSFMWFPDKDTIITYDRANAKDPVALGGMEGYSAALRVYMEAIPALKYLNVHSQFLPSLQSGYVGWTLASGTQVRVNHLLPASVNRTIVNEATAWVEGLIPPFFFLGYWPSAAEKDYHVRISPTTTQQWDTFLNCWDYDAGTPVACALVQDTSNKVDCALLASGTTNRLACFNALQGPDIPNRTLVGQFGYYTAGVPAILDNVRKRVTGFTVVPTFAGGTTTKVTIADLDTSKTWSYQINGGGSVGLTPTAAGVGTIALTQTGAVTIAVSTTGVADLAVSTTSPFPNGTQGVAYSHCATATGGQLPYTWTKSAGTFPTGLTLTASTGCVAGTPSGTGLSNFTLLVTDSQGTPDTASRAFDLTVDAATNPVLIETTFLPDCTVDVVYPTQTIAVSGGTGPYTTALAPGSGSFPTGLILNADRTLTGTCTVPDEFTSTTVRATDSVAAFDDQDYNIRSLFAISDGLVLRIRDVGSTFVTGDFGGAGLAYETDCIVRIGNQTVVTTEGPARRAFTLSLTPSTTYVMTASCDGYAFVSQATFTTDPTPTGPDRVVRIDLFPSPVHPTAARATVYYDDNAALSSPFSIQNVSCSAACQVYLTLPAGKWFFMVQWQTSADVVLASSTVDLLVVK